MGPGHIQTRVPIIGAVIVCDVHRLVQSWMRGIDVVSRKCVIVLAVILPQFSGHIEGVVFPYVLIELDDVGLIVFGRGLNTDVVIIEGVRRSRCWGLVRRRVPRHDGLSHGADLVCRNDVRASDQHRIALRAGACAGTVAVLITADCRMSARIGAGVGVVGRAGCLGRWVVNSLVVGSSIHRQAQQTAKVAGGLRS